MRTRRLLVTGAGGIGGVDFVRALRYAESHSQDKLLIVGTEYNPYHIHFPEVDVRFRTPKHTDNMFVPLLKELCKKYNIEFLHPHPSSEARVVAERKSEFREAGVKTLLPRPQAIAPDKLYIHSILKRAGVPTPPTIAITDLDDVDSAFKDLGSPLWIRASRGAGGRLSLLVRTPEEAKLWIKLNVMQGRAKVNDFIIQEYLPGRDLAFDSLWFEGKLVTSYVRERLEYPFKHITLTGITGTPTVARTVTDEKVSRVGINAVKALDPIPNGFYSVDLKENVSGNPVVTEVDGKWHTTAPLWGYAFSKVLKDPSFNLAYAYLRIGLDNEVPDLPKEHLFPPDYYLIRQLDSGVLLIHRDKVYRIV